MSRALALFVMLCLPAGATCLVERHGWQTWVCDLDAEKPATGNREGDHVWAKDSNKLYYWDGAAWLQIGAGGGGGAPTTATYITQTPDATLSAEQAMSLLGTGLVKNTTGTGVQSIYAGAVCASSFVRQLSASGAPLCDSVNLTVDVSNSLGVANGGTGLGSATDDNIMLGDGVNWASQPLPNCNDSSGRHLNYDTATNTISCGTSSSTTVPTASALLDTLGSIQGSILERSATGWTVILPGQTGSVLTSVGPASDPVWYLKAKALPRAAGLPKVRCNAVRRTNCS
jgi:hypothetical protein